MDNTLSLLYTAAVARGLPHDVTRNLNLMRAANDATIDPPPSALGGAIWNGQLPPGDARYQPGSSHLRKVKNAQQRERERVSSRAMDALSDLIGMAEGRGGVSLGRVERRRQV